MLATNKEKNPGSNKAYLRATSLHPLGSRGLLLPSLEVALQLPVHPLACRSPFGTSSEFQCLHLLSPNPNSHFLTVGKSSLESNLNKTTSTPNSILLGPATFPKLSKCIGYVSVKRIRSNDPKYVTSGQFGKMPRTEPSASDA